MKLSPAVIPAQGEAGHPGRVPTGRVGVVPRWPAPLGVGEGAGAAVVVVVAAGPSPGLEPYRQQLRPGW